MSAALPRSADQLGGVDLERLTRLVGLLDSGPRGHQHPASTPADRLDQSDLAQLHERLAHGSLAHVQLLGESSFGHA